MNATRLRVGDRLPPLVKPPIERMQLVKYAGASGDWNRIHYEDAFALAGGFPSVIAHGMLSMGFVGQHLTDAFGPGSVRRLQIRFKAVTFPGDTVTCHAEVTAVHDAVDESVASPGAPPAPRTPGTIDLRVWAETQRGQITVEGTASIALRSA